MFRRVNGLIAHGHQVANNANYGIEMGKALVADLQDGFAVRIRVTKGFSLFVTRFVTELSKALLKSLLPGKSFEIDLEWMEGCEIPLEVTLDPKKDVLPPGTVLLDGGPWDGKQMTPRELAQTLRIKPPTGSTGTLIYQRTHDDQVYQYSGVE